jgi:hypothetical protein
MTRDRVSVILLNVGGVLMGIGALLDLSVAEPPALWEVFLGQSPSGLPAPVQQLLVSLLHALGSVLLAASLAVLLLVNGPVRRRDPSSGLALLMLAIVGEGGNGLQMILLGGAYGWGVLLYIVPIVLGLLLRYASPESSASGSSNAELRGS